MNKTRTLALIISLMSLPANAVAEGWYVRGEGAVAAGSTELSLAAFGPGVSVGSAEADLDPGLQVLVAGGRDFGQGFRLEAASLYTWTPVDGINAGSLDVNASLLAGLVQGSYVLERQGASPFVSLGLGHGIMRIGSTNGSAGTSIDSDGLVWRVGSGAEWQVTPNTVLSAGYSYTSGDFELFDPKIHAVTFGARIRVDPR